MEPSIALKVAGSILAGTGALILAIRIKTIVKWIVYTVVAHEISIQQIQLILEKKPQTQPMSNNVTKHLLATIDNIGFWLFSIGVTCIVIGNILTAVSIINMGIK